MIGEIVIEAIGSVFEVAFDVAWDVAKRRVRKAKNQQQIQKAAQIINDGGLVAFPTETVYGLGANAKDARAVSRIYTMKERPTDNPLIIHIHKKEQLYELTNHLPEYASDLAAAYWPGPLTLIVNKQPDLPSWFGGSPTHTTKTVGVRMPNHPTALALIEASGCFIAAPSANKAGKPSPTMASHLREDYTKAELEDIFILEGQSINVGIESTVVDCTANVPVILRPGAITPEMIKKTTKLQPIVRTLSADKHAPRSPGMKYRHYAPKAPMTVVRGDAEHVVKYIQQQLDGFESSYTSVGVLIMDTVVPEAYKQLPDSVKVLAIGTDQEIIAQKLYAGFRRFDALGVDVIFAEATTDHGIGIAIMDRMIKAAEGCVVDV